MIARFRILFPILIALFALTSAANAQIKAGGHGGFDFEASDFFLGLNIVVPTGFEVGESVLSVNGDISYWITSDFYDLLIFDANVLYPFAAGPVSAYAGGGLAISIYSYDGPDFSDFEDLFSKTSAVTGTSSTDFGLNLKGGGEYGTGKIRPFGELGYYLKDGGFLYLQFGARFLLGE